MRNEAMLFIVMTMAYLRRRSTMTATYEVALETSLGTISLTVQRGSRFVCWYTVVDDNCEQKAIMLDPTQSAFDAAIVDKLLTKVFLTEV